MKNIRVLVVDDEDNFRQAIARRLQKRDIIVEQASSGEEALSILAEKPIDVVVLDVKMPVMDGLETLHHIKRDYPRPEVIFLTGHATTQDGVVAIKEGAFDYLGKPVEFEHLVSKIQQANEKIHWEEERAREAEFRAKMEQQMVTAERLAALGTLSTGVAHEINNPLAIISESVGWMKLLLERKESADLPLKGNLEMALAKIEKSVERAKIITHQLLKFARKTDSIVREVKLDEIVDEVIQLVGREVANKDIDIVKESNVDLTAIWSDPYQLRQVLVNLITNAIQATDRGGKVVIHIETSDEEAVLSVQDTGHGIPKENLERIFDPFFTTKSPGEGTGLGLSVSRGIIEKLGGRIEVESRIGHGATFRVRLPGKSNRNSRHGLGG